MPKIRSSASASASASPYVRADTPEREEEDDAIDVMTGDMMKELKLSAYPSFMDDWEDYEYDPEDEVDSDDEDEVMLHHLDYDGLSEAEILSAAAFRQARDRVSGSGKHVCDSRKYLVNLILSLEEEASEEKFNDNTLAQLREEFGMIHKCPSDFCRDAVLRFENLKEENAANEDEEKEDDDK